MFHPSGRARLRKAVVRMDIDFSAEIGTVASFQTRNEGTLNEETLITVGTGRMSISWNRDNQGWGVFYDLPDRSSHDFASSEEELRAMVTTFSAGGLA